MSAGAHQPRYFSISTNSQLGVDTISELKLDDSSYVSRYGPGPITVGFEGSIVWAPTVNSIDGILLVQRTLGEAMAQCGLSGMDEMYPVIIRKDWPAKIHQKRLAEAPAYVWFRIRREIMINPDELAWPPGAWASATMAYRKVPVPDSQGKSDVFGAKNLKGTHLFCTRRFLENARREKWKGLVFEPMDMPYLPRIHTSIDYLGKTWPPERWYPEGIEGHPNNLESA